MSHYKLVLEYDGTAYHGWQEQAGGPATVAGSVRDAISRLTGERPRLDAAGRTDAGAHSLGQTVSFDLARGFDAARLMGGLNALLPADIAVREADTAEPGFHARFSARRRTYRYLVENRPERGALLRDRAWHVREPLDLGAMRAAAAQLLGEHDLAAFGSDPAGRNTVRDLSRVRVRRLRRGLVAFDLTANAFLYGMVRRMVGFLVEVGLGRRPAAQSQEMLRPGAVAVARVAPARGLYQLAVEY
ncbi:MAG TPA: tRNA pseudouridine(38-40) synthase TruA [Candidatus Dormibacteraeota bacterium]|nr:tRNA pseudouridine(38-40) synthase TruA [Candidatus Dormibacteraeota bacterium]